MNVNQIILYVIGTAIMSYCWWQIGRNSGYWVGRQAAFDDVYQYCEMLVQQDKETKEQSETNEQ